jgi:imidazole glycerol-phosphate synthase subunit HisH
MIKIVDYGSGNINAIANIYKRLDMPVSIARGPQDLKGSEKVILPGVGAFDHVVKCLNASGMRTELERIVLEEKKPILGICVGMQILGKSSEEGVLPGLGWIEGEVKKIDTSNFTHEPRLPHMGWNDVIPLKREPLFINLETAPRFYFLHSYYFDCANETDALAVTDYGGQFSSAVRSNNVFGVQFHPEKSHQWGIQLLKNFGDLYAPLENHPMPAGQQ